MAKTKNSKSKTSIFLCCFRSHIPNKPSTNDSSNVKVSNPIPKQKKSSWFSWRWIKMKMKSTSKTVPLEASFSHYSKSRSKFLTLHHKSKKTLPTNPPPSIPPSTVVLPGTPYYTPTQTRHGPIDDIITEDTHEQGRTTPTRPKRQERRLSSTTQNQTTIKNLKNVRSSYDPIVGMSILGVTLVIMIFWGRFCAILCTSAWLYFIPRFRNSGVGNYEEDGAKIMSKNDVDFDSEEYKKKVIMEGLLGRNNRGSNI